MIINVVLSRHLVLFNQVVTVYYLLVLFNQIIVFCYNWVVENDPFYRKALSPSVVLSRLASWRTVPTVIGYIVLVLVVGMKRRDE